jgi:nucleoid-associated protein YgaU
MARETRIGLLIGLAFVVVFGLVLSELTAPGAGPPPPEEISSAYRHTYVIDESRDESGRPNIRISRSRMSAEASRRESESVAVSPPPRERREMRETRESILPAAYVAEVRRDPAPRPSRRVTKYAVQRGDTLIGIARKFYGRDHEQQYRRIFQANQRILPDEASVMPGQVLVIPPLSDNRPVSAGVDRPAANAGQPPRPSETNLRIPPRPIAAAIIRNPGERSYVVKQGETLQEIAYSLYRDDSRRSVMKIYDANEEKLRGLDHLPTGMALVIPR